MALGDLFYERIENNLEEHVMLDYHPAPDFRNYHCDRIEGERA